MDREGLASLLVYGNPITRSEIQLLTHFCVTREEMLLFPLDGNPVLFVQRFNHVPNARRAVRGAALPDGGGVPAHQLQHGCVVPVRCNLMLTSFTRGETKRTHEGNKQPARCRQTY